MTEPKKVAVLGGGVGALTAALKLTEDPATRANYDVTVYQLGWRLGGKCASGRDVSHPPAARVYEHGLHIFAGFYYNAFGLLKDCYDDLQGQGGVPAANVYHAFKEKNEVVLFERVDGEQIPWPISFLPMPGLPHDPPPVPTVAQFIEAVIEAVFKYLFGSSDRPETVSLRAPMSTLEALEEGIKDRLIGAIDALGGEHVEAVLDPVAEAPGPDAPSASGLHHALVLAKDSARNRDPQDRENVPYILSLLDTFEDEVKALMNFFGLSNWVRRLMRGANLAKAVIAGIEGDDVVEKGFDHLDNQELKDWLRRWGAWEETVQWAPVDAGYDYAFAFYEGDESKPSLGAGTGLRGFLRLLFAYKGALFWEMKGSMGEVVILPMYEVLRRRGVKFRFFSEVRNLGLSADGSRIEQIGISQQAAPLGGAYDPLIDLEDGLKSWPDRPKWADLDHGAEMEAAEIDLESPWSPNPYARDVTLKLGADFDEVVLGISVAEVRRITPELSAVSAPWKAMVEGLQVSRTIGFQVWTKHPVGEGGGGFEWPNRVCTRTEQPLSTWSDMSFLLPHEFWPEDAAPQALYYFTGQLAGAAGPQNYDDPTAPAKALATAREDCKTWLRGNTEVMMPEEARPELPLGLDPDTLFVDDGSTGLKRFDWQYCRVNMAPSELYVQSAPNTLSLRMHSANTGFANLYLAGDWTRNGLNAGCVEAAVMSGMQCAYGVLGLDKQVPGEADV
ncbi:MAG: NAD(P)-binding protein [Pseudomonadota bacterium]